MKQLVDNPTPKVLDAAVTQLLAKWQGAGHCPRKVIEYAATQFIKNTYATTASGSMTEEYQRFRKHSGSGSPVSEFSAFPLYPFRLPSRFSVLPSFSPALPACPSFPPGPCPAFRPFSFTMCSIVQKTDASRRNRLLINAENRVPVHYLQ